MGGRGRDLAAQLRRERLLDMETRIAIVRRRAFTVLALALIACGPWIGFWFLIPLAAALVASLVADRLVRTRRHAHRWAAGGWAVSGAMIAGSVALTGAADSPAVMWLALPAVTLGARFELRGVGIGVGYLIALMILSTMTLEPQAVLERPDRLIFPIALVIATAIFSAATQAADREHRRVDHFKRVNDEHGHPAGDAVLRDIAYAMRKALRAFDLVYRIGGEEFVVLLPGADLQRTIEVGERLRVAVAESRSGDLSVTMSFGAAAARGRAVRFADLYAAADVALYAAKRSGRDRVCAAGSHPMVVA
jgi:diguanylate cyclase (GGDEF)-like protein